MFCDVCIIDRCTGLCLGTCALFFALERRISNEAHQNYALGDRINSFRLNCADHLERILGDWHDNRNHRFACSGAAVLLCAGQLVKFAGEIIEKPFTNRGGGGNMI